MAFDLLNKTELRIEKIALENANLNAIATAIAGAIGIAEDDVLVTDLRDDTMTIDILRTDIDPYQLLGKKDPLLQKLSTVPGVSITEETSIHSEGMLGWIAHDNAGARPALERSEEMADEIRQRLSKRVMVFSTGIEVASGQIEDTNRLSISQRLEAEGYAVSHGPTLKDDEQLIAGALRQAIDNEGFSLVITTGGVGAEDKDKTVEAVLLLDPKAATPYITRYRKGTGRHHKDGVRIAVGEAPGALIVALPGPNDEVQLSLDILVTGLKSNAGKGVLAESIAGELRENLRLKMVKPFPESR